MITAGANEKTGGATDRNDPAGRLRLLDTNAAIYKTSFRSFTQWRRRRSSLSSPILRIRWPMWFACWGTSAFSVPGHISTACVSGFTWRGGRSKPGLCRCADRRRARHDRGVPLVFCPHRGKAGIRAAGANSGQNRQEFRHEIEREVRYANITIIEGIGASQHGIGMASARIAESCCGMSRLSFRSPRTTRHTGSRCLCRAFSDAAARPRHRAATSDEEREALQRGADTLKSALARIQFSPS